MYRTSEKLNRNFASHVGSIDGVDHVLFFYDKTTGRFFARCQDDGKNGLRLV
jgi:hypothetical protein